MTDPLTLAVTGLFLLVLGLGKLALWQIRRHEAKKP